MLVDIGVIKIVITNFSQTVLLQRLCKCFGAIMRREQFPHFIHTDIFQIALVILYIYMTFHL